MVIQLKNNNLIKSEYLYKNLYNLIVFLKKKNVDKVFD
ncbi:hypothetical protein bcere0020_22610 [Bacillus cereus Rock3-29]|nr:hypothetical protein bcere0020_22610 [Bacillus cereus Rock3-29]